jgi:hypothetical protein
MLRLLAVVLALAALVWWFGSPLDFHSGCVTVAYPARCRGAVVGNRCHGDLIEALPRREFRVDRTSQRVTETGIDISGAHPRCRVNDCRDWECIDEIFVRTAHETDFREQLRPGLTPVDPTRTLSVVYVSAREWWQLRAKLYVEKTLKRLLRKAE